MQRAKKAATYDANKKQQHSRVKQLHLQRTQRNREKDGEHNSSSNLYEEKINN